MTPPLPLTRTVAVRGMDVLNSPVLNKGTAFTNEERSLLNLHGLLPPQVETIDQQVARAYEAYCRKDEDLERHIYLRALQDTNEVLFYRLLLDHITEMTPIVYTPVVALGCQNFSHIYRRPRGLFISYPLRESIPQLLQARPNRDVDVVVVTDGERVLGIGDQGVGGLGISIGKLSLYTLMGGIHPSRTLPIILDVGTNNAERLQDPEYLGWRHERVTGQEYLDFVDRFVQAVKQEMPATCLQWEDFASAHARPILQCYRDQLLTFNDDIQGTAAVALGAIASALRVIGQDFKAQHIVILGAGSAAIGVADCLHQMMVADGLTPVEARRRFWLVDKTGLVHTARTDLTTDQAVYAQSAERVALWLPMSGGALGLGDVIGKIDATVLIGLSTAGGAFTEAIVKEMASKTARPIILPLSNPTAVSEATAANLVEWTGGRALVATGSPFDPVTVGGRAQPVAQCNNVYIFPGLGLGVVAARATRITDGMMLAAARTLAVHSPTLRDPSAPLLPPLTDVRRLSADIAYAVGQEAQRVGVAPPTTDDELGARVDATQWTPAYPAIARA